MSHNYIYSDDNTANAIPSFPISAKPHAHKEYSGLNGPYSGLHEYENSFKYIPSNFNPGIRKWENIPHEKHIVDGINYPGESYVPINTPAEKKFLEKDKDIVDVPIDDYILPPPHPPPRNTKTEIFNQASVLAKLVALCTIIYIIWCVINNNKKLLKFGLVQNYFSNNKL
jgi:hypothetical protein